MSRKIRRQFDGKFKTKVVIETLRERKTLSEICKEYDLHPNQITDWKKLVIDQLPSLFERGEGVKKAEVIDNDTKSITGIAFRSPLFDSDAGHILCISHSTFFVHGVFL